MPAPAGPPCAHAKFVAPELCVAFAPPCAPEAPAKECHWPSARAAGPEFRAVEPARAAELEPARLAAELLLGLRFTAPRLAPEFPANPRLLKAGIPGARPVRAPAEPEL